MSQLGLILQESREARTILGLLTEQMDGAQPRRRTLKERLRFTAMGCCGATWVFRPTLRAHEETNAGQDPRPSGSGMNLAAALAAERQFREGEGETPSRVSLMRLLEETEAGGGSVGNDSVCCVCMGRKKGAAFIPCGHTFCRLCSKELLLNRGTCPLCNRSILDILHIF
ncbi:hypothetical protein VNO78_22511 [Psophocarpus tetragonolobus]|uniref:RING-type domain-containing protein n=1 Tax=Psophocarpus tetragonolobus TaxID=3891 RepID=A0AAN9XCN6_PSOTE